MRTLWNVWEELIQGYQTAFVPLENLYPNNASVKVLLQQIVIEAALLLAPPCNTTIQSLDNGKINGDLRQSTELHCMGLFFKTM